MDRSTGSLLRELVGEASAFVQAEVELVRTEMRQNLDSVKRGGASMATGGAILHAGVLALTACVIIALADAVPTWLSALIVGAALCAIGAIMVLAGKRKMQSESIKPERTIHSLKGTQHFMRDETSRAKEKWQ